jgi:hypothetical protein
MNRNSHWPDDDGRRWSRKNIGFCRGAWHGPYPRRRWRRRRWSEEEYRTAIGVLALVGAISLGAIFLMLLNQLIARCKDVTMEERHGSAATQTRRMPRMQVPGVDEMR